MRIFLLHLFLLISVFSFAQKTDTVTTRWPNGRVQSVKIFANEKEHGTWMFFNDSGMLVRETNYRFGKLHGKSATFLDNGNQLTLEYFKDGLQDSMRLVWYPDGHLKVDEHYKNGKPDGLCRTFSPDGHIRSLVRYVNNLAEGNYLKANEQGLTIEEGYAWHGKWIWYRKFCYNKLCEMRGLDTITGRDSIRNFDEHGYMIRKEMYLKFDSLVYVQRWNWTPEGFLMNEDFRGNEKDGYYYQRHKQWTTTPDTFLLSERVDSCSLQMLENYKKQCRCKDPLVTSGFVGMLQFREVEFYASGKVHFKKDGLDYYFHSVRYSENGIVEEDGYYSNYKKQGFFILNSKDENGLYFNQHSWYNSDKLIADTVFYADGKIKKAFLVVKDGKVFSKQNQYYSSGKLEQEKVVYMCHRDYDEKWYYETGKLKSSAWKKTNFIRSRENKIEFNENGTRLLYSSHYKGHVREYISNERKYANGKTAESRIQKQLVFRTKGRVKYKSWSENGNRLLVTKYHYKRGFRRKVFIRRGYQQRYDSNGNKSDRNKLNSKSSTAEAEDYSRFSNQW